MLARESEENEDARSERGNERHELSRPRNVTEGSEEQRYEPCVQLKFGLDVTLSHTTPIDARSKNARTGLGEVKRDRLRVGLAPAPDALGPKEEPKQAPIEGEK